MKTTTADQVYYDALNAAATLDVGSFHVKGLTGADIELYQRAIIDSGDAERACEFARIIDSADVVSLQQVVVDAKDELVAYEFSKYVLGADDDVLGKVHGR